MLAFALLASIASASPGSSATDPRPHVILVSMDTTRADALSAYGGLPGFEGVVTTPNLDRLAAGGARFERFFTHAPTTLSSHATMLSGLDPHGHAIVRNGSPLREGTRTLAERLGALGWDTIGVVGAAALEAAMGLDRGFRVYDDDTDEFLGLAHQRRAAAVVDATFAHLDQRDDGPLFLFVHFYDPHAPYLAPEPYGDRFTDPAYQGPFRDPAHPMRSLTEQLVAGTADPSHARFVDARYLGEVAYLDDQLGRLLAGLRERGILDHALLIVTADHGEGLEEAGRLAWSHGSDVGLGVMRVPLIVRGYGVPVAERAVVRRQAAMSGLAKTVELAVGVEPTLGDGVPFWEIVRAGPVRDEDGWPERPTIPVMLEATRPRQLESARAWNNLPLPRGVVAGGWAAHTAPCYRWPWTYYDGWAGDAALLPVLEEILGRWDAAAPPHREAELAPGTERALEALGYLE